MIQFNQCVVRFVSGATEKQVSMKNRSSFALMLLLACSFSLGEAHALSGKIEKIDTSAKQAYEEGDFKKAQTQWEKLRAELAKNAEDLSEQDKVQVQAIEARTLRQIGECALQLKSFAFASDCFNQARKLTTGGDSELDKDLCLLSNSYRLVDPATFGSDVANAFKEVGAEKIAVSKTNTGHHIEILLADKFVKAIGQRGVSEIGFDKTITFELSEPSEGEIRIDRITGLKVHVQFWVNVIASRLHKNDEEQPIAEVTGEKMGISQSISSKLPDQIYQPVMALIGRVKSVFNANDGGSVDIGLIKNAINGGAMPAGEVVPASNSGTENATIEPLVNDQPEVNAK